jgi:hypothetical protein
MSLRTDELMPLVLEEEIMAVRCASCDWCGERLQGRFWVGFSHQPGKGDLFLAEPFQLTDPRLHNREWMAANSFVACSRKCVARLCDKWSGDLRHETREGTKANFSY